MKIGKIPSNFNLVLLGYGEKIMVGDVSLTTPQISLVQDINRVFTEDLWEKGESNQFTYKIDYYEKEGKCRILKTSSHRVYDDKMVNGTIRDVLPPQILFKNLGFIYPSKQTNDEVVLKRVNFNYCVASDTIDITDAGDFVYAFGKPSMSIGSEEIEKFFENSLYNRLLYLSISQVNFASFSKMPDFEEIKIQMWSYLAGEVFYDLRLKEKDKIQFCIEEGCSDFYTLFLKSQRDNLLINFYKINPIVCGKPYNSNIFFNSINSEILSIATEMQETNLSRLCTSGNIIETLTAIEKDPFIGIDGLKSLYEMLKTYSKVYWRFSSLHLDFRANLEDYCRVAKLYYNTPFKEFLNSCIKATFKNAQSTGDFLEMGEEYVKIAKSFNIPFDGTLPKNLTEIYDYLLNYCLNMKTPNWQKSFTAAVKISNIDLNDLPESPEFTAICPESVIDLVNEGISLHNYVGNLSNYCNGVSRVFFIRNKSDKEKPFYTIEMSPTYSIIRVQGLDNSKPIPEVEEFIDNWIKNLKGV